MRFNNSTKKELRALLIISLAALLALSAYALKREYGGGAGIAVAAGVGGSGAAGTGGSVAAGVGGSEAAGTGSSVAEDTPRHVSIEPAWVWSAALSAYRLTDAGTVAADEAEAELMPMVLNAVRNREDDQAGDEEPEDEEPEFIPVHFTVTEYETEEILYANTRVNIRAGADTTYDKLITVPVGTQVTVNGETDNGWYQVIYNGELGFMKQEYLQRVKPGTPLVLAGDSRTVQMSMAVKNSSHAWIAKVGEGYTWFSQTAISQIDAQLGEGSILILNFGVNDLGNVSKYIKKVNAKLDTWLASGATVYYASVGPVGSGASVTNEQIESFNRQLQEGLDSRIGWIDEYDYLSQRGFSSNDGLHYNFDTYRDLYSYYMSRIE